MDAKDIGPIIQLHYEKQFFDNFVEQKKQVHVANNFDACSHDLMGAWGMLWVDLLKNSQDCNLCNQRAQARVQSTSAGAETQTQSAHELCASSAGGATHRGAAHWGVHRGTPDGQPHRMCSNSHHEYGACIGNAVSDSSGRYAAL